MLPVRSKFRCQLKASSRTWGVCFPGEVRRARRKYSLSGGGKSGWAQFSRIRSARCFGDSPLRSPSPCSVTMTCTSCSVWSTWVTIGTMQEMFPAKAPRPADPVHDRRPVDVRRVDVAVDVGFDHPVHREAAEPPDQLRVVRDLLRPQDDAAAVPVHLRVQLVV